jgi:multidrug efflux pump subunit AcrB
MYLILGAQFHRYWQPFMILTTVPMAFTGVVLGLVVTGNPLSLFTLYGVVALAGVAVNSAIVLISGANDRLAAGMSLLHATLYAARRRLVPILITSLTTIAGLFSLAAGLGGSSLVWGPVATAIVWGIAFSTVLTLLLIPLLYRLVMGRSRLVREAAERPA